MVFTKEWKCCQAESSSVFAPGTKLKTAVAGKQVGEPLSLEGREALEEEPAIGGRVVPSSGGYSCV